MARSLSKDRIESFCGDVLPLRLLGGKPYSQEAITWRTDSDCVQVKSYADYAEPFTDGVLLTLVKPGRAVVTATFEGVDYPCTVEIRPRKSAESGRDLQYYVGDMHDHTWTNHKHADFAVRTEEHYPLRYLEQLRDEDLMDLSVVSDHASCLNPAEFFRGFDDAETAKPMRTVIFAGSEAEVSSREPDRYGVVHKNSGEIVTLNSTSFPNTQSWADFFDEMADCPVAFCTLAHPQIIGYSVPGIWNFCLDKNNSPRFRELVRLVETGDGSDRESNIINEYTYSVALDNGFRISPTCSSDSHGPIWGYSRFPGKTIFMAPERSKEAFLDAVLHNRVYACQTGNVKLYYEVNGHAAPADLPPADEYRFDVSLSYFQNNLVSHPVRCQVISNEGLCVADIDCTGQSEFSFTVHSEDAQYFYLRLLDIQGKKTLSCPVWTGRAPIPAPTEPLAPLDKKGFTAVDEMNGADASVLLNDDPASFFRSEGTTCSILIDMQRTETIAALSHYPRQLTHEMVKKAGLVSQFLIAEFPSAYRLSTSVDGEHYTVQKEAHFRIFGGEETIRFPETPARYVRLEILSSCGVASARKDFANAHIAMAELTVWKKA